jgi:hypothetical protein
MGCDAQAKIGIDLHGIYIDSNREMKGENRSILYRLGSALRWNYGENRIIGSEKLMPPMTIINYYNIGVLYISDEIEMFAEAKQQMVKASIEHNGSNEYGRRRRTVTRLYSISF